MVVLDEKVSQHFSRSDTLKYIYILLNDLINETLKHIYKSVILRCGNGAKDDLITINVCLFQ